MKMVVKFIMLAVLVSPTLSECNEGCLVCRPNGTCLLCDFVNAYYVFNNSCSKDTSGNCQLYQVNTANGSCLLCNRGYFIDSTQKCVEVTTEVENCARYAFNDSCVQCVPGFILSGNSCVEVVNKIANCQSYDSATATTCLECESKYILAIGGTSCNFNPSIRNCANFSHVECLACETGTVLNQNAYLDDFKTAIAGNSVSTLNSKLYNFLRGSIDQIAFTKCISTDGTNCSSYNSIGTCAACLNGFFLNNGGQCVINPIEPIDFCAVYSSLVTCGVCETGFHLDAADHCVVDTVIPNCQSYDPSAKSTTCTLCGSAYFLSDNACVLRTNAEIENCATYSATEDLCSSCTSPNVLAGDRLKCLAPVENCAAYVESNVSTQTLTCSRCQETYYLSSETSACVAGTVSNCRVYQDTSNVCSLCRDGFYLTAGACVARTATIANCATYSPDINDSCATCSSSSLLFQLTRMCKTIVAVENCSTYEEFDLCSRCQNGFYLTDNTCLAIPAAENCLQKSDDACTLCSEGFYLAEGACFAVPELATVSCSALQANPTSPNACLGCNQNYVPLSYTNKYLCRNAVNLGGSLISNCTRYVLEAGVYKCTRCQSTHVVSSDGLSCVLSCGGNETVMIGDVSFAEEGTNSSVSVDSFRKCFDVEDNEDLDGCASAALALNAPGKRRVCLRCRSGFIPVQSCPVEISYFDASNVSNTDLGASHVALECTQNADARFAPGSSASATANCRYYVTDGNSNYYCKKCEFGFTSSVQVENGISFVTCSEQVVGCDGEVKFGGALSNAEWMEEMFGFNIAHAFTCHKCSADAEIPFLHLSYQNELMPYGLGSNFPSASGDPSGHHVVCRRPDAEGLAMSEGQFTSFPANCALGLYVVDKLKRSDGVLGSTALCLACKNGFRPVYDESEFLITGCEAIANCNTESTSEGWFNGCKTCAAGHVFQYDVAGYELRTSTCVATTSQNCYALRSDNSDCAICNKNFVLNYDGVCENLKPNSCSNYVGLAQNNFSSANTFNNLSLAFFYLLDEGCVSCNNDFVLINETRTYRTCNLSSYVQAAAFPAQTAYIARCASYQDGEGLTCRSCESGFIPNDLSNRCTLATAFPNCSVTNSSGTACTTCNATTTNVDSVCVARSISNCEAYAEGSATITCQTCAPGFVLQNNACSVGAVANCRVYDVATRMCATCDTGYVLVTKSGVGQQCMAIPTALNCSTAELGGDNQELVCSSCAAGFGFTSDDNDVFDNTCVQVNLVANCSTYDIQNNLVDSTFKCTLCSSLYFLSNSACIGRSVTTGCASFSATENKCTSCSNNFYLDSNGVCKAFVVGVKHCEVYSNATTCSRCLPNYFLSNNTCTTVNIASRIEECTYYSNATACSACTEGFVLTGNVCAKAEAQNCATYTDINNCSSCATGFYLQLNPSNQVTNCVEGILANCTQITSVEPLACLRCSGAFVVGADGSCVPVTTVITNCLVYDNESQLCTTCSPGFILGVDRRSCVEFAGPAEFNQCSSLRYMSSAVCTVCSAGYYFDESICVKCSSQNYQTGCLYCDYASQETCLVCRSGFIQDTAGNCAMNHSLITAFENQIEHLGLASSLFAVVLGFLLLEN